MERYAWFPYNIHSANDIDKNDASGSTALFDYESGKLTENGFLYASIGLPEGYPQTKLTEEDKYIYVEPTSPAEETTTVKGAETKTTAAAVATTTTTTTATTKAITVALGKAKM